MSVRASTLLNIDISETSGLFATKFYLKHHWGGGKAALCFGPDRIGTLSPAENHFDLELKSKIFFFTDSGSSDITFEESK